MSKLFTPKGSDVHRTGASPILALSAAPDVGTFAEEIGAAGWIAKPFDVVDVLEKVARLCPPA